MKAQLIQFHISPKVREEEKRPQNGFNLEFVAINKYIAEDMRGIPEFRREYRHKMNHIVEKFNEYYQWNIDKSKELEGNRENFGALDDLADSIKYMVNLLKHDFIIPNELELTAIHMVGDFNIYDPGNNSELKKNASKIREESIKRFRQRQGIN